MGRIDWSRYAPPGRNARQEAKYFSLGILGACAVSLQYLLAFYNARSGLFIMKAGRPVLRPGALMPDFGTLLGWSFAGFWALLLCAAVDAALHAAYHYQEGSRPVYLMRRLPDRWEYARRCLAVPVAAAVCALLTAAILLGAYYAVYMICTPAECLTPDQWQKIWRAL